MTIAQNGSSTTCFLPNDALLIEKSNEQDIQKLLRSYFDQFLGDEICSDVRLEDYVIHSRDFQTDFSFLVNVSLSPYEKSDKWDFDSQGYTMNDTGWIENIPYIIMIEDYTAINGAIIDKK